MNRFQSDAKISESAVYQRAERRDSMFIWGATPFDPSANLATTGTGLAHGASGIGLALLELSAVTGRLDFLEAGRGAFAYENTFFDAVIGNWVDRISSGGDPIYEVAWCHGAPGIALARARAAALDPAHADEYRTAARRALQATLLATESRQADSRQDACLCHGLSGLGDVLLIAARLLGDGLYEDAARSVGNALVEHLARSPDWPAGGSNPSLMVGLAGIGYWFLRLADPLGIPSVLMLTP